MEEVPLLQLGKECHSGNDSPLLQLLKELHSDSCDRKGAPPSQLMGKEFHSHLRGFYELRGVVKVEELIVVHAVQETSAAVKRY